jgi:N-acetylmuramoyl-L-alanine amidase
LGIEMCAIDNDGAFDPRTGASAAELTAELCGSYGIPIDRVGTHHLVVGWKDCPRLWTRFPKRFEEFKERVKGLT